MADHHYLPQVYLRGWCIKDRLLRYRKIGQPPTLREDRVSPRGTAFEPDLYRLPEGGVANGLVDNEVEKLLSRSVESGLPKMLAGLRALGPGVVADDALAETVRVFMRVTAARRPEKINEVTQGIAALQAEQAAFLERLTRRARTAKHRDEIRQLGDLRQGAIRARALVAAFAKGFVLRDWLAGPVQLVRPGDVRAGLQYAGVESFTTTDWPVVEWDNGPLVASFVMAPDLFAIVLPERTPIGGAELDGVVADHHLGGPARGHTRCAIGRSPLPAGSRLRLALEQHLTPWEPSPR